MPNNVFRCVLLFGLLAGVFAGAAVAHHSYAMFDRAKTITITGTVTKFEWTNPHVYLWVTAADAEGKPVLWAIEGGSPVMLARQGWKKDSAASGENVTVTLNPLRDGRPGGYFIALTRADGTKLSGDGVTSGKGFSGEKPAENR